MELSLLPADWENITISEFCGDEQLIVDGPFGSNLKNEHYVASGIPVLSGGNISGNTWTFENIRFISQSKAQELIRCNARVGDLLTVKIGSVGFSAQILDLDEYEFAIIPANLLRIRVNRNDSDPTYLKFFLQYEATVKTLQELGTSTAQPALNLRKFRKLHISRPPHEEQKVIAEALSDIDELITFLKRELIKKINLRTAFTQHRLKFENATKVKLGKYADFSKGSGLPKSQLTINGKFKAIHYGELFLKYPETIKHILSRTDNSSNSTYSKVNDVLMPSSDVTPTGLSVASCIREDDVILGGDVLIIRPNSASELDGRYLSYVIRNSKQEILKLVRGTTVYHIYGKDMAEFELFIPEIEEQIEIVESLDQHLEEISLLEEELQKYQWLKLGMMHDLLTGRVRLV